MSLPSTQTALLVKTVGEPLEAIDDRPVPQPGPGQVLLKVTVAGLNPHDEKARDEGFIIADKLPAILTNDVVGRVVALGPEVTKYQIGDRVLSHAGFAGGPFVQNGLQQYAINGIEAGFKIPDQISDDEAATLPTNIIAPLFALFDKEKGFGLPLPWTEQGKDFDFGSIKLLVVGGGSNCGKFGVQLAKLAGIGTIVVVGGPEDLLKQYGATHVVDRHGGSETILEQIRAVTGDDLEYVFDAVNPPPGQVLGLNALSSNKKGKLARLLPLGPVDDSKVVGKKAGYQILDVFGLSEFSPQIAYPFWERVPDFLITEKIKPLEFVVKNGLLAEHANEVLDGYRDGRKVIKTHIHV